jgi:hypothetical protein
MARPAFGSRWANGPPMAHGIAEGSIKIKAQVGDHVPGLGLVMVERVTGIEPALSAWEAEVLPLNYTRMTSLPLVARSS